MDQLPSLLCCSPGKGLAGEEEEEEGEGGERRAPERKFVGGGREGKGVDGSACKREWRAEVVQGPVRWGRGRG